jgi:WhiB family redox-sensing transcriptional regulator
MCAACPVQIECAEYALRARVAVGVWGGTTESERKRIRAGAMSLEEALA